MMIDAGKIWNGFTNDIMVWYHDNERFNYESFYCEVMF
uniref:Scarabaecin peptide, antimicrobial peptide, beetle n=1 Tax=Siphoviridae sp. ct96x5 TaxID=2825367 RepID=A0A8S5PSU3_9CAUD|nr:MAG TPA: scarabaecin peptide, antimicrobial peptide, beetle [Siphoviridae sp. ct96x5]